MSAELLRKDNDKLLNSVKELDKLCTESSIEIKDLRQKLSGHELAAAMLVEAIEKAKEKQHQSDLNYNALEKQNTRLTEELTQAKAEIERLRQQISSEKVKP